MDDLAGLVARLEALPNLSELVHRLEAVTTAIEGGAPIATGGGGAAADSTEDVELKPFVGEYDDIISGELAAYVACSKKLGGPCEQQAVGIAECFAMTRELLTIVCASKKPDGWPGSMDTCPNVAEMIQKIGGKMMEVGDIDGFKAKQNNHCKAVEGGVQFLSWVVVEPTPGPHCKDMAESMWFYGMKVLVEAKGSGSADGVDWANSLKALMEAMVPYVKKNHTTGLTWNPQGGEAKDCGGAGPAAPAGGNGKGKGKAAPPPPPPDFEGSSGKVQKGVDMEAMKRELEAKRAALDKGEGFKKVTKKAPAMGGSSKVVMKQKKTKVTKKMGTPKLALEGSKWACEYHVDDRGLIIADSNVKQTLNIYRCVNACIQVKGKINAILLDDCDKVSVVCNDVVSSIDIVNCNGCEVQADGKVPTILIDKTDGCQLYLGPAAVDTTIITSKVSEINCSTPGATEEDDQVEQALPEQFSNLFDGKTKKWVCSPVTHG
jgi:adenylyl cyclase-associated protein